MTSATRVSLRIRLSSASVSSPAAALPNSAADKNVIRRRRANEFIVLFSGRRRGGGCRRSGGGRRRCAIRVGQRLFGLAAGSRRGVGLLLSTLQRKGPRAGKGAGLEPLAQRNPSRRLHQVGGCHYPARIDRSAERLGSAGARVGDLQQTATKASLHR